MRKNSLFIVLAVLVVLSLFTTLRLPFSEQIKQTVSEGFVPFFEFSSRVQESTLDLMKRTKNYTDLQKENIELKKKLSEISTHVAQVAELERENRDLRAMLDFKNRSELKLIIAKVISRDPSNWYNTVLVDRGLSDGVRPNMPVLTVDGLVGKTIEVTKNHAHVLLIVDENCKVSSWTRDSGQFGIVQGNILSGGMEAQCRMTLIDRHASVKENEKIYTSGLGGIFPKNILIGTVSKLGGLSGNSLTRDVYITPAANLAQFDDVFIGIETKSEKAKGRTRN